MTGTEQLENGNEKSYQVVHFLDSLNNTYIRLVSRVSRKMINSPEWIETSTNSHPEIEQDSVGATYEDELAKKRKIKTLVHEIQKMTNIESKDIYSICIRAFEADPNSQLFLEEINLYSLNNHEHVSSNQ